MGSWLNSCGYLTTSRKSHFESYRGAQFRAIRLRMPYIIYQQSEDSGDRLDGCEDSRNGDAPMDSFGA